MELFRNLQIYKNIQSVNLDVKFDEKYRIFKNENYLKIQKLNKNVLLLVSFVFGRDWICNL